MGVHIIVQDAEGNEHPEWDFIRQGDDRENARRIGEGPHQTFRASPILDDPDGILFRPDPDNPWQLLGRRGEDLNRLLENPRWWVRLSY